ncbi:MAG: type II toxin-antitoxin system Phd/YefM family antitoxin [Alphaproteobacteria bacterium]|nr:type II toxin-antitoxin system Phd/YefM family antitoxin [Alphaproteobacteria bacterium]
MTKIDRTAWAATLGATEAKNAFGHALETAIHEGPVLITKHQTPRAVLISVEKYEGLVQRQRGPLDALSDELDTLLDQMQTPETRAALDQAFNATPEALGQAALLEAEQSG